MHRHSGDRHRCGLWLFRTALWSLSLKTQEVRRGWAPRLTFYQLVRAELAGRSLVPNIFLSLVVVQSTVSHSSSMFVTRGWKISPFAEVPLDFFTTMLPFSLSC